MRRFELHAYQIPAVREFLAKLKPREELTYRLALSGMFPQFRSGEWQRRRDELLAELAPDEAKVERYLKRAKAMEGRLRFIITEIG